MVREKREREEKISKSMWINITTERLLIGEKKTTLFEDSLQIITDTNKDFFFFS